MENRFNNLIVNIEGNMARVILNRPKVHNALNYEMIDEVTEAIRILGEDSEVRVIVISGKGKSFCAGDDLKSMGLDMANAGMMPGVADLTEDKVYEWIRKKGYENIILSIRNALKPVIASVQGHALGAGCDLALACDFRVVSKNTNFGLVYVQHALALGIMSLPQMLGIQAATDLLFTGRTFSGKDAYEKGLVNVLSTNEKLEEDTLEFARQFAKMPTASIGLIKESLNRQIKIEEKAKAQAMMVAKNFFTADFAEGLISFIEKRQPEFIGK